MGRIKVLKSTELLNNTIQDDIYPITSTQAVYDTQNNRLSAVLDGINTNISTIINKLLTPEGTKPEGVKKVIVGRAISRKAKFGDVYFNSEGNFLLRESSVMTNDNSEDILDEEGKVQYVKLMDPDVKKGRLLLGFGTSNPAYPSLFIVPENWEELYYNLSKSGFSKDSEYYEILVSHIVSLNKTKLKDINYETTSPYVKVVKGELKIVKKILSISDNFVVTPNEFALFKQKKSRGKKPLKLNINGSIISFVPKNRRWNRFYTTKVFNNLDIKYTAFGLYKIHSLWRKRLSSNYATFTIRVHYKKEIIDNIKRKIPTGFNLYNIKYIE